MAETSTGRQLSGPRSARLAGSAAFGLVIYFMSTLTCQTIQSGFASVFPESCRTQWSWWFTVASDNARDCCSCFRCSCCRCCLVLLPLTGCECDILRVSVSHCWSRDRLETEGSPYGLHTMRHVKFFFALSAVAFAFSFFLFRLYSSTINNVCMCSCSFFHVTVVSLSAIFSMLPKCLLTACLLSPASAPAHATLLFA